MRRARNRRLSAHVSRFRPKAGFHGVRIHEWSTIYGRLGDKAFLVEMSVPTEAHTVKSLRSTAVPKPMQAAYDAVVALTDAFCRDHLTEEYRGLGRAMAAALSRKRPSLLTSGQPRTWACGIIHALGQLNFLSDKASQPHMTMVDICAAFGVGQSTASAKARVISDALHTNRMDPTWMLKGIVDRNPLVWMAEVNGMLVDLRDMPREVQVIAYEKGMIPYIPADWQPVGLSQKSEIFGQLCRAN